MSTDDIRPIVVVHRNGVVTPLMMASLSGVMLLAMLALLLSRANALGLLVMGTATAVIMFGGWKSSKLRNKEYRAEVSGTDVRWVEQQETRIVRFDDLDYVTVWTSTDPNTLMFVLKNGRIIDPGAGFPDPSALFEQ